MKKLFFVIVAFIGICAIMPTVKAESNAASAENYICSQYGDVKVGDYVAWPTSGSSSISISVYSYANACYSYYAVINGEQYAVRENPEYGKSKYSNGYTTAVPGRYTHYVQYRNNQYYFSI